MDDLQERRKTMKQLLKFFLVLFIALMLTVGCEDSSISQVENDEIIQLQQELKSVQNEYKDLKEKYDKVSSEGVNNLLPTIKRELVIEATILKKETRTQNDGVKRNYIIAEVGDTDHNSPYLITVEDIRFKMLEEGKKYILKYYFKFAPSSSNGFSMEMILTGSELVK